jgi:hypothetical protein
MGRRRSEVLDPALFCEFNEECLRVLQTVIDEGVPAIALRDLIDSYANRPGLPISAMDKANELVKEVVERRLQEAVTHVSVTGPKHSGQPELDMLAAALSDQHAANGVSQKAVKEAEVCYANLEARLLNREREGIIDDYGPLSPRSAALSLKEHGDMSRAKISAEVSSLLAYLTDKRLTSDAKSTACLALLKIVRGDPVVSQHLIPKLTTVLPKTMHDPDESLQTRAHSIFVELLLGQQAIAACCRCLKHLADMRPVLKRCRDKLSRNETRASRPKCFYIWIGAE